MGVQGSLASPEDVNASMALGALVLLSTVKCQHRRGPLQCVPLIHSCTIANTAYILSNLFNSTSRQCHKVWASPFPFLHIIKHIVPSSEACLHGHINWFVTQAHQQTSFQLSQSSLSLRGAMAIPGLPMAGLRLMFRNILCQSLVVFPGQRNFT